VQAVGIHHVALNVADLDEALAFYTGPLGMTVRTDRPDLGFPGAWLDVAPGGGQLHLLEIAPPAPVGQHVAIQVADLGAVVTELRTAGVTVSDPSAIATSLQAFCSDPSGNAIELHQAG
jgi:glyoxylase I family protein